VVNLPGLVLDNQSSRNLLRDAWKRSGQDNFLKPKLIRKVLHGIGNLQFVRTLLDLSVTMDPYINVGRPIKCDYTASASNCFNYANYESEYYMQNPMSNNMHALNINTAHSDTNHAYMFSLTSALPQSQMPPPIMRINGGSCLRPTASIKGLTATIDLW
jgi:hypothetical protein